MKIFFCTVKDGKKFYSRMASNKVGFDGGKPKIHNETFSITFIKTKPSIK